MSVHRRRGVLMWPRKDLFKFVYLETCLPVPALALILILTTLTPPWHHRSLPHMGNRLFTWDLTNPTPLAPTHVPTCSLCSPYIYQQADSWPSTGNLSCFVIYLTVNKEWKWYVVVFQIWIDCYTHSSLQDFMNLVLNWLPNVNILTTH